MARVPVDARPRFAACREIARRDRRRRPALHRRAHTERRRAGLPSCARLRRRGGRRPRRAPRQQPGRAPPRPAVARTRRELLSGPGASPRRVGNSRSRRTPRVCPRAGRVRRRRISRTGARRPRAAHDRGAPPGSISRKGRARRRESSGRASEASRSSTSSSRHGQHLRRRDAGEGRGARRRGHRGRHPRNRPVAPRLRPSRRHDRRLRRHVRDPGELPHHPARDRRGEPGLWLHVTFTRPTIRRGCAWPRSRGWARSSASTCCSTTPCSTASSFGTSTCAAPSSTSTCRGGSSPAPAWSSIRARTIISPRPTDAPVEKALHTVPREPVHQRGASPFARGATRGADGGSGTPVPGDRPVARRQLPDGDRASSARSPDLPAPPHQVDAADQAQDQGDHLLRPRPRRHVAKSPWASRRTSADQSSCIGMFSEAIHNPLLMDRYLLICSRRRALRPPGVQAPGRRDRVRAGREDRHHAQRPC